MTFGRHFTLKKIMEDSLEDPDKWQAFTNFCEKVIKDKEVAERC